MNEQLAVDFVKGLKPIFNYEKFKHKRMKKFDGKELNDELMNELQSIIEYCIEYKNKNEVK